MKKILVGVLVASFLIPSLSYAATIQEQRLQLIQLIIQEIAMLEAEMQADDTATSTPAATPQFGGIAPSQAPSAVATVLETGAGGISIDVTGTFDSASVQVTRPDGIDFIHGGFNPSTNGVYHYGKDQFPIIEDDKGNSTLVVGDYKWIITTRVGKEGENPIDTVHTGTLTVQ